jgi:hypothetical protein
MSKRRRKRLFPKQYQSTYISAPRIDHNKAYAYNQQRSKATVGPRWDVEPKLDNNFMEEVPRTNSLTTFDPELIDGKTGEPVRTRKKHQPRWPTPRKEAVDLKHEMLVIEQKRKDGNLLMFYKVWQGSNRLQGVHEYHSKLMKDRNGIKTTMYFSGLEVLFVMEDHEERFISKTYRGMDQAMWAYNDKKQGITWLRREKV